MTVAALIECDLRTNGLGLPSRALERIADRPILALTLARLARCAAVDRVAVVARPEDHGAIRQALGGLDVAVLPLEGDDLPRRAVLRRERKWSRSGWRGGPMGACVVDEFGHPALLDAAETLGAETIVPVSAEWPWIDPALLEACVRHHQTNTGAFGFTFSQAPPGLLPAVFARECLAKWVADGIFLADIIRYAPDMPRVDPVVHACCFQAPGEVLSCEHRLSADTARGVSLARAVCEALGPDADAAGVCRFAADHPEALAGTHPHEVVLEVTTRRPVEDALRPLPPTPQADLALDDAVRIIRQIAAGDDTLLTLGGRGDPLAYPQIEALLAAIADARCHGTHLVTYGRGLTESLAETLVRTGVDAVTFLLDAAEPPTYAETKGGADLQAVLDGMARLSAARKAAGSEWPIAVVEFIKTRRTLPELEVFYDGWLRRGAWPVIRGPTDLAGLVEDLAVVSMAPARRTPCRRLFRRLTILADGRVPSCEEDVLCRQPLGNALQEGIDAIWRGDPLHRLRRTHEELHFGVYPACRQCREWHRP